MQTKYKLQETNAKRFDLEDRTLKFSRNGIWNWNTCYLVLSKLLKRIKLRTWVALAIIAILSPIAYLTLVKPEATKAAWWNGDWQYRKVIPISSHTAAETNVYIAITAYDASDTTKYQTDCGDVRFTKENGELLPYTVASCGVSTTFNVNFDSFPAGAQDIYLYYGNANAPNGFETTAFATEASGYVIGTVGSEATTPGPVAWWKFDEGQGQTVYDNTAKSNGTLGADSTAASDDPTWIAEDRCVSGKCLQFDGSNDLASVSDSTSLDITGDISLSAWVRTNDTGAAAIMGKWNTGQRSYWIGLVSGSLRMYVSGNGTTEAYRGKSSSGINDNKWHHVEAIYDNAGTLSIYVDGKSLTLDESSGSVPSSLYSGSANLQIGHDQVSGDAISFTGFIDDVKIYPYARSAAEVKADFSAGAAVLGAQDQKDFLSDGLVGYWKMDESAANGCSGGEDSCDSSGNGHQGTWNGDATTAVGKFGNGTTYDGTGDYTQVTNSTALQITGDLTISVWVNPSSVTGSQELVGKENYFVEFALGLSGTDMYFLFGNGSGTYIDPYSSSNANIATGTWQLLTVVRDTKQKIEKFYKNGVFLNQRSYNFTVGSSNNNVIFGRRSATLYPYTGKLDEVRIYNRALSADDVRNLYNWAPGPVGHWKLDEGSANTCTGGANDSCDTSGNGNDGAWNGNATVTDGKFGNAVTFDGNGDYVNAGDVNYLDGVSAFTISAWVKTISRVDWNGVVNKRNSDSSREGMSISGSGIGGNDDVILFLGNGSNTYAYTSGNILSDGVWNHWEMVFDGTQASNATRLKFYFNGIQQSLSYGGTIPATTASTTDSLVFGAESTSIRYLSGTIDDVRVYNYARTSQQIVEDMNAGHPTGGSPIGSQTAYWSFDEQQGQTTQDRSVNNLDGILGADSGSSTDDPTWKTKTNCKINGCLSFDGGDYVTGNTDIDVTNFTITSWVYRNSGTGTVLAEVNSGASSSNFHFRIGGNSGFYTGTSWQEIGTSATPVGTGSWKHVALTYDGSNLKYYVDGKLITSGAASGTPADLNLTPKIGRLGDYDGNYWNGYIDEVKIYNSALTEDQVRIDMNAGSAVKYSVGQDEAADLTDGAGNPPVLEMKLDEKTGTTTNSTSGTFTGTLTSGPTWVAGKYGSAVNFDGSDDFVDIGTGPTSVKSVAFWVYPATTTEYPIDINGTAYVWINAGTVTAQGFTSPTIYVNGVVSSTVTANSWQHIEVTTGTALNASDFDIGRIEGVGNHEGRIDQVVLYDYARTQAQVAYDYNRGAPIGWWKLDECQGTTANDASGNGNNGTITVTVQSIGTCTTSSTAWGDGATGKYGSSLKLDGTGDYISAGSSSTLNASAGEITVSAWVKPTTIAQYDTIAGRMDTPARNGWALAFNTNRLNFYADNGAVNVFSNNNIITTGTWQHVVVTYKTSGAYVFYLNGKNVGSGTDAGTITDTGRTLTIGRWYENYDDYYLDGQIDDVRIYNYALSAAQIRKLFNEGGAVRYGN